MPSVELSICLPCGFLNLLCPSEFWINLVFQIIILLQLVFLLRNTWVLRKATVFLWMTAAFFPHNFSWTIRSIILWERHDTSSTAIVGKMRNRRITTRWECIPWLHAELRFILGGCPKPTLLTSAVITSISTVLLPAYSLLPLPFVHLL